jgi:hypothetical protein
VQSDLSAAEHPGTQRRPRTTECADDEMAEAVVIGLAGKYAIDCECGNKVFEISDYYDHYRCSCHRIYRSVRTLAGKHVSWYQRER